MATNNNEQIKLALAKCIEQMLLRSQSISVLCAYNYIGSNNVCSDIIFYYYDYKYVDSEPSAISLYCTVLNIMHTWASDKETVY